MKEAAGGKKKQAVNPYLPSWEYIPDGMCMVPTIIITDMYSAWGIMCAGRRRWKIWEIGDTRE